MKKESLLKIFSRMPVLETERLTLRAMQVSDAEDMYDYAKRPDVTRYLLWRPHTDIAYTRQYLTFLSRRYRIGMHYEWAIVLKESGHMIGTCGFANIDCPNNTAEIGYVLHPDHHGKGIVAEAALRVMRFGFSVLGLHRIEARFMKENTPSEQVMKKLGMHFEGIRREAMLVKGLYRDIGIYAILANEFRAMHE